MLSLKAPAERVECWVSAILAGLVLALVFAARANPAPPSAEQAAVALAHALAVLPGLLQADACCEGARACLRL